MAALILHEVLQTEFESLLQMESTSIAKDKSQDPFPLLHLSKQASWFLHAEVKAGACPKATQKPGPRIRFGLSGT